MVAPVWLAGTVTIVALIILGIFVYPWLLGRRRGGWGVAAATVALAALYFSFDRSSDSVPLSIALAALWAVAPLIAGVIVHRMQRQTPAAPPR